MSTDEDLVLRFNDAITAQRVDDLARLMTSDHRFIDAEENVVDGKQACVDAWAGFFSTFPDYRNEFDELRGTNGLVSVCGRSHCSNPELDGPALWSVRVSGGMVAEWRVYEDNGPNRRVLGFAEAPPDLQVRRPEEAAAAEEMTMARGWLDHLRNSAIFKVADLDDDQLRWKPAPTANSLGQIVVHLGYAERLWLRAVFAGEPMDMAWRGQMFVLPEAWSVDAVVAFYRAETAAADSVLDGATSFDLRSGASFRSTTLRWVVMHLIEETARHVGHMDITRELLDGRVGR